MMKNKIYLLLLTAFSVMNGMAQGEKSTGEWYLDEVQYKKAYDVLVKEHQSNPTDVKTINLLGDAFVGLNKTDEAKNMYTKALALAPKDPFVMINLGKIALLEGKSEEASDYFDKAKKADRKNPAVYSEVAASCFNFSKKDTITGNSYLTQGMAVNSKYPGFHMIRGDWELYKKNFGKAANAYENAIFFDPNNYIAHRKLGDIYAAARFNRQSLEAYNKSIAIQPNQILVFKGLGDLYYSLNRFAEAEQNYQTYLSKADVTLKDKERYAIILFFNKKYNESAKVLEDVLDKNADQSILLRIRGYIAYETEDYKGGLDYMNKFFQLHDPNEIIASDYLYYGRLLEKSEMDVKAMENYKKALAMDSTKTEIYENLANLSSKNNMRPQAIEYYYKMIDQGADKLAAYFNIGKEAYAQGYDYRQKYDSLMKLQRSGNFSFSDSTSVRDSLLVWYTKADSAYTMVSRLNPEYAGGFLWKGRMANYLDPNVERSEAKEAYEKALIILEKDVEKNKRSIIECYRYLAWYNFSNSERIAASDKQQAEQLVNAAKDYYLKILALDAEDKQAKDVIEQLEQLKNPKAPAKKK